MQWCGNYRQPNPGTDDQESYPSDSYEPLEDLICTNKQLHSFMKTIEGCTYRLKQ